MKAQSTVQSREQFADIYRLLIESVQDYAIFALDAQGHVATWNAGAERIKGYQAHEIIGRHFSTFYSADDLAARKPQVELEIAAARGRVEDEGWRIRKDGSRFWANIVITALRDADGVLTGFGKVTRDLTQRRSAEEALRRSEERFRLLVESIGDYAIYMLDADGRVSTWNSGAENIKGYSAQEIIGQHFSRFFAPEDIAAGRPNREIEVARSEGRFEEEAWRVRKDGTRFWANVILTAVHDARGELVGFAKITRDLTTRREAEALQRRLIAQDVARRVAEAGEVKMRAEGERYRLLGQRLEVILEGVADGITALDAGARVLFANSAAARMCGFASVEELLALPPGELAACFEIKDEHGRTLDADALPGARTLKSGAPESALLHVRNRATEKLSWFHLRASPVFDREHKPVLAVNIWHDVSEEHRRDEHERYLASATSALASSLDHREMLTELARILVPGVADWCAVHLLREGELENVAVAHVDADKVAFALELQRRYPSQKGVGLWRAVEENRSELLADVPDAMLVSSARDAEHLRLLRMLGMRSAMIVPIRVRDEPCGTLSLVSSSEARRYDRSDLVFADELGRRVGVAIENARLYAAESAAARRAEESAARAEQVSRIKDEFLATVSHELRTPLNAIVGWAQVLRDRPAAPALAKGLEVIQRNAQAQAKIIDDILDVSRIITGKLRLELQQDDLTLTVGNAIEVVSPSAKAKRIAIELRAPAEPCLMIADHERLQQVVWNLLSNAVKFTDPGGKVTVSVNRDAARATVVIADTGVGIDPALLPHVFERFKQGDSSTTRRVGGLGLGLAIVRHIVELHGGEVVAESGGAGLGATFSIALPLHAEDHVAPFEPRSSNVAVQPSTKPPGASLEGVRVLLVDDKADARDVLQLALGEAGASVQTASSSNEGFGALFSFHPHVLVSDVGMPNEDGYSFMRRVRALRPDALGETPAIALTAYTRSNDRQKALEVGFTSHLSKPVVLSQLIGTIAELAKRSR